jgi:MFS superfamily sulfate permease-like transporter
MAWQRSGVHSGGIPKGLPKMGLPEITLPQIIELIGPAIAMQGGDRVAVVADGMADTKHDFNQELIGQGIANQPVAGFGQAGALILLIFLAPLASDMPLCALAAILFVVAYNMSELKHFKRMVKRVYIRTLREVIEQLHKRSIVVNLCEANEKVLCKLNRAGARQVLGLQHYPADFSDALVSNDEIDKTQG